MLVHTPLTPPGLISFEHATQGPLQTVSQQKPSAQKPLPQAFGVVQGSPLLSFGPQTPRLLQNAPVMQSTSPVQVVRHAPVEHLKNPQDVCAGLPQVPEPSHVARTT